MLKKHSKALEIKEKLALRLRLVGVDAAEEKKFMAPLFHIMNGVIVLYLK